MGAYILTLIPPYRIASYNCFSSKIILNFISQVAVWENLFTPAPLLSHCENAQRNSSGNNDTDQIWRQKMIRKVFRLIETNVSHYNCVSHPSSSKWRMTKMNGSTSDSDSAFYPSDASDNRHSADSTLQIQRLQYLRQYTR